MDTELASVAYKLAQRGWLPGIFIECGILMPESGVEDREATEADLHLAAHNEIVRRGWSYYVDTGEVGSGGFIDVEQRSEPDTTTLSLLRALLAACEAEAKR